MTGYDRQYQEEAAINAALSELGQRVQRDLRREKRREWANDHERLMLCIALVLISTSVLLFVAALT